MEKFDLTKYHPSRFDFIRGRIIPIEELIEEADTGDVDLMEELADIYLNGDEDVEPDPVKCVYWLRKAAEAGNSNCMFNMGLHYAKGYGMERDFDQAVRWMEIAAAAGDEDAPDAAEQYRIIADSESRAKAGDARAQAELAGILMELGKSLSQAGSGRDFEDAFRWAKLSAEQGNADGMWSLALAYEHGRGTEVDLSKAVFWYEKGSEAGNAECTHNLAVEYLNGRYLEQDFRKGFQLTKQAVQLGSKFAPYTLGSCYQFGYGCNGNMKRAVEWYERSLKVMPDSELEQKVAFFKIMGEADDSFGKDYNDIYPNEEAEDEILSSAFEARYGTSHG